MENEHNRVDKGNKHMYNQFRAAQLRCRAVLAFILSLLLSLLQLKYQGNKDISPFDTHPTSVRVAIASFLLYCFASDPELRSSENHRHHQTYALIARPWDGMRVALPPSSNAMELGPLDHSEQSSIDASKSAHSSFLF
ncbi:hypothetical protein ACSBR2_021664 [Camellia fascicularis]